MSAHIAAMTVQSTSRCVGARGVAGCTMLRASGHSQLGSHIVGTCCGRIGFPESPCTIEVFIKTVITVKPRCQHYSLYGLVARHRRRRKRNRSLVAIEHCSHCCRFSLSCACDSDTQKRKYAMVECIYIYSTIAMYIHHAVAMTYKHYIYNAPN